MAMTGGALFAGVFVAVTAIVGYRLWRYVQRVQFVRDSKLPASAFHALRETYPQLDVKSQQLVARALRQFFIAYLRGGRQPVAMPSRIVDALWHGFILDTHGYARYCRRAFGRFLHHAPAGTLGDARDLNTRLRRTWWHCCKEENLDPRAPSRLPLLFALDRKLNVEGGYYYALDEADAATRSSNGGGVHFHYATDFSDTRFDGSTDGFGDSSGDGGGDGGGCGGD